MPEHDWRDDAPLVSVADLDVGGWERAPDAPVWSFLPAVWPSGARAWVPDHESRLAVLHDELGTRSIPMSDRDRGLLEDDLDRTAAMAGFPDRPRGRVWYLAAVGGLPASAWCERALVQMEARPGGRFCASPELTALVRELLGGVSSTAP